MLKLQVDQYNYLMHYDEVWLEGTGVTRNDQRTLFVQRDCLRQAAVALAEGQWVYASRLLAFAWSIYPGVTVRRWQSWALAVLLATGPVGIGIAWLARALRKQAVPSFEAAVRKD